MTLGTVCVGFSRTEVQWLQDLGAGRNGSKPPEITRRATDVFTDPELDYLGLLGEAAWSSYLNLPLDTAIHSSGDSGHDLVMNGKTVAVKFNHRWRGFLMVEERENDTPEFFNDLKCDIIALAHGRCQTKVENGCRCRDETIVVCLAGWLTRDEFMRKQRRNDWGLGGRYTVSCSQLRPPHELLALRHAPPRRMSQSDALRTVRWKALQEKYRA